MDQVRKRAETAVYSWPPNVVLINAGTNDATQQEQSVVGTGLKMRALIDTVFAKSPHAVVILSTLLPNSRTRNDGSSYQDNIDSINAEYRKLYREYVPVDDNGVEQPGYKVILAEMAGFITDADIHDGTHPTIEGNRKMAAVWDWAIGQANDKGWLVEPSKSGTFEDSEGTKTCKKKKGSGNQDVRSGQQILYAANSIIRDDGTYKHGSRPREDRNLPQLGKVKSPDDVRIWFAQLVNVHNAPKGGERDECIWVWNEQIRSTDRYSRKISYRLNEGDGAYSSQTWELDVRDGEYFEELCGLSGKFHSYNCLASVCHCMKSKLTRYIRHSLGRCCKLIFLILGAGRAPSLWASD